MSEKNRQESKPDSNDVFLKYHTASQNQLDEYLINSCIFSDFEHIKYLLTSPNLKRHANIHANKDSPFEYLLSNENKEVISYLIFECNLVKTRTISKALMMWPTELADEINNMFKSRDLTKELKKDLSTNEVKVKRNKV